MSKRYTIKYLKTAEQDLYDIFDYIKKDNPTAARTILEKIDKGALSLADNPESGIIPKDIHLKNAGYRILIIEKYLLFYIVKQKTIQIRRVLHGSRNYPFLF
ncbi:MAG: type II toxin-antitoxin system RelE/ParE family toxin [bacterium]|nr:type II toxin-antitoxin system RelE/ParE family toxin [bacterium]